MNAQHLSKRAVTLYESLEDADLVSAAVNIVAYRGRTPHAARIPGITRVAYGPRRFFYFNLFESDQTGAPFRMGARHLGANDRYAAAVGRWLVTRDGFDLLVYYLPDYDYASHAAGPDAAHEALGRADDAVGALVDAAGGIDELLERYAVVVCSDHGQTHIEQSVSLQAAFTTVDDVVVTASNRAGMVYDLGGGRARELAERLDGTARRRRRAVPGGRRRGRSPRRRRGPGRARVVSRRPRPGDRRAAEPERRRRARLGRARLRVRRPRRPSPRRRWESWFARRGRLRGADADGRAPRAAAGITGVAPMLLDHLAVERPAYARTLSHVG
jgi:hypothetical protein